MRTSPKNNMRAAEDLRSKNDIRTDTPTTRHSPDPLDQVLPRLPLEFARVDDVLHLKDIGVLQQRRG